MPKRPDAKTMDRREFLLAGAAGAALLAAGGMPRPAQASSLKTLTMPELPYAQDALAPHISAKTLGFHYGKHHAGYFSKLMKSAQGTEYEGMGLIASIEKSHQAGNMAIFNNAAQVFNHTLYWHSMKPGGGGQPKGALLDRINRDFGSYDKFRQEFSQAAATQFGSGWAWLVLKDGKLAVMKTSNADSPLVHNAMPLMTIDVWEHAYYLDYQNRRADYIATFMDHLVNWDFAARHI